MTLPKSSDSDLRDFVAQISIRVTARDLKQADEIIGYALDNCPFETFGWTTTEEALQAALEGREVPIRPTIYRQRVASR